MLVPGHFRMILLSSTKVHTSWFLRSKDGLKCASSVLTGGILLSPTTIAYGQFALIMDCGKKGFISGENREA
ncbi:MAG: hypothetical protein NT010_06360 [Proteobacteria bacterium]|nr:hypothetical protein [Pseudomonadota bacterium]